MKPALPVAEMIGWLFVLWSIVYL